MIGLRGGLFLENRKILLLDDVMTSGETIKTCLKLIEKDNIDYLNDNIILVEFENKLLGFIKIYYKSSLDAYGFNSFLHPTTSLKLFKDFTIYSCYNLSKGLSFLNKEVYNFYLDVPSLVIAKWVKQVSMSLRTFKIYPNYIICYTSFSNLHLKNILLNIE